MINDKIFQMIYDELSKYLPEQWTKLVVYLEHGEASYSYSFYVMKDHQYTKCFDLPDISEDDLLNSFKRIEKEVSEERNHLETKWSNMTMVINSEGNMKTDFDYSDLSQGNYEYKEAWKKKYLV
ncbi:MAG TPA: DUF600 family protein [Candidatus Fimiplasma intestinipullorum]|uniref:DUF600 family protein n=1 Tax=Candidatus Fimiplasma intestinipullorum TaxID=2840825 RepID=A0A9D1HP55_9FIRM|nr:DUF600 family protein [Candidatus Fimiplasma intestinipullorum]